EKTRARRRAREKPYPFPHRRQFNGKNRVVRERTMSAAQLATFVNRLGSAAAPDAEVSDCDLLDRYARRRDEAAFAALVRRHGRLVWNVCRCVLPSHHDAEDAFQAAFLALAKKAGTLPADLGLAGWLHGTAYRSALELKRKAAR